MKKVYVNKTLVVAVILLFISVSVIPSTGIIVVKKSIMPTCHDGDTLYVGGNGSGNYTKIQDAINDSSNGDTVFVYDDSSPYYENVVVDKSINLIGEDRNTTGIDGNMSGDVVYVSADWVNISGLTIRNSGLGPGDAGIDIHSNSNTLSYNIISYNGQYVGTGGILIWGSISNNSITGNNISNNYAGICFSYSSGNIITGNSIANNGGGIEISNSNYNNIMCNNITSNYRGIYLDYSSNNIITDNNISGNGGGINLDGSSNNNITGNNIQNNHIWGMTVSYSVNNIIEKNNFIGHIRHVNIGFSNRNTWNENYWDNWIGIKIKLPIFQNFPKIIFGFWLYPIPFPPIPVFSFAFDRNPAQEPYDIP